MLSRAEGLILLLLFACLGFSKVCNLRCVIFSHIGIAKFITEIETSRFFKLIVGNNRFGRNGNN